MGSVYVTQTQHKAEHVVRDPAGKVIAADAAEQVPLPPTSVSRVS